MSQPEPSVLQRTTVVRLLGGFVLCMVVVVYVHSRWNGHWPPSHPWSGIALTAMGVQNLLPRGRTLSLALAILVVCSSLMWAWSSLYR